MEPARATEIWGITAQRAVGRKLDRFASALPHEVRDLPTSLLEAHASSGATPMITSQSTCEATDAHGRRTRYQIRHAPVSSINGDARGVVLFVSATPGATVD